MREMTERDSDGPSNQLNARHSGDAEAYEALRDTWLNRRRAAYVLDSISTVKAGARVLEIGSGTGYLLLALAKHRPELQYVGVDPLPNYIEHSRNRAAEAGLEVRFEVGYAEDLGGLLTDTPVDVILSNDTLHHVADIEQTAAQLAAVSAPGAIWVAIEPSNLNPYIVTRHYLEDGERNFRPRSFRAAARRAGWEPVSQRFLFAIPPAIADPPTWMTRMEPVVERIPVVAGGVVQHLRLRREGAA